MRQPSGSDGPQSCGSLGGEECERPLIRGESKAGLVGPASMERDVYGGGANLGVAKPGKPSNGKGSVLDLVRPRPVEAYDPLGLLGKDVVKSSERRRHGPCVQPCETATSRWLWSRGDRGKGGPGQGDAVILERRAYPVDNAPLTHESTPPHPKDTE